MKAAKPSGRWKVTLLVCRSLYQKDLQPATNNL